MAPHSRRVGNGGQATKAALADAGNAKRETEWSGVVNKYRLRAPASLRAFVGESFALADFAFAYGAEHAPPPMLVSTIQARQAGFHDCMDTEDM